ncbi:MAG: hypothetical protein Q8W51_04595 [Candidatus Palauibacterales bacterium]|nr:hypothetical protein [Candidatus Palauibacterales bacterium]MDP2528993.1 hypothetical protein [Candidatus Palauibacterales bacterium]MDP2583811.1 hypothetical protein [Candidatus Palauibacterales bacterium]
MANGWIIGILGIWMVVTPFLGFASLANSWIDWIVGVIVAIFAFTMTREKPGQGWSAGIVSIWLFIAGFIGGVVSGAGAWWNDILVGLVFMVTGFTALPHGHTQHPQTA